MDAGSPDAPSGLDQFLESLFKERTATIDEIYDASVSFAVESDKLARQVAQLPAAFAQMLLKATTKKEYAEILDQLHKTRDALAALIEEYEQGG